ncbi:amidohydrolase family protein [Nocardia sp. XZ_19_385]|uniref:metal-dependent hydrolase family protein n=1 Tax=Nocardia sp. XZ_19_385 TaxID=2769488 RepID=UPI0018905428|nr:amidohydrolase family protein [Nocardia sp. XZ_19_385]
MTIHIIEAARILTGCGPTLAPGTVVLADERIAWVGQSEGLPARWAGASAERIGLPEATLLPGLIDAHVHLSFGGDPRPPVALLATTRMAVAATIHAALRQLRDAGITTVRDLGAPRYIDASTLGDLDAGPRVLTATIPLTVAGGHCAGLGGVVTEPADIDRLVAANAARGADWIKVMVTGGFTTGGRSSPYEPQFTDAQLARIVAAARVHGLPVAAHAHGTAGIRQAVGAGVDSLEHCTWMSADGFDLDHEVVREIADRRILVCPTINHQAREATGRLPWAVRREQLRVMLDAGVRLIPGTDSGIPQTPHYQYAHSLPIWTDLGYSASDIIKLATSSAAQALRIDHLTGTLTAGRSADLIAVPGDPTSDLGALTAPVLVATAGHLHYPANTTEENTRP